ncbi:9-O-acetylesterase [Spirochaetia bacterium]|nr:9-O-acetylesterase [Spirochaetia bacterium]GHU33957.1 9-O-acetylesterase [Spirochaetia bacterium]
MILATLISDSMVLQHNANVPVWGRDTPYTSITVHFLEKTYDTTADDSGVWQILLDPESPGGPYTMEISAENPEGSKIIRDIYVGDVWLCSGQSNMELPLSRLADEYPEEFRVPVNSRIRQLRVPLGWNFKGPAEDILGGKWVPADPETLMNFSGTAWFFAKQFYKDKDIAVGLIVSATGGSPIESWMSKESLAAFPEKSAESEQYADPAFADKCIRENDEKQRKWYETLYLNDEGLLNNAEWFKNDYDDSEWRAIDLPGFFNVDDLETFSGIVWIRKNFDVPYSLTGKKLSLWLGTIVDADTVYINGKEIGGITYRYPPRKYIVPEDLLHEGINQITIRIIVADGNGGFTPGKPFHLFSGEETIELSGQWKYKTTARTDPRPEEFFIQWQPCGLFNAMLAPLLRYPVTGILWYQGESNDKNPQDYAQLFPALINDWRRGQDIPFIFVQLPLWGEPEENTENSSWALIREAQCSALSLAWTGMAAALDLGEWNDLHPLNKKDVGFRLALAAQKLLDNKENSSPGPILKSVEQRWHRLVLTFDNCGSGLRAKELIWVTVVDEDQKSFRLPAYITGTNEISVSIIPVKSPQKILYAWAQNPRDRQLFNTEALPAIPFRKILQDP